MTTRIEKVSPVGADAGTAGRSTRVLGVALALLTAFLSAGCATKPVPNDRLPSAQALAAPVRQGNPMAQFVLGVRMLDRAHTSGQRAAGVAWIRRAARANLAIAQDRLGWMYLNGRGVPQDTARAVQWLRRAAERGAPAAQLQLGQLYAVGALVPVDQARAYFWYSVAAKPVRSSVTIFNIVQVRFFARRRAQALALSLTFPERVSIDRRVAAWMPLASVPYSGRVPLN